MGFLAFLLERMIKASGKIYFKACWIWDTYYIYFGYNYFFLIKIVPGGPFDMNSEISETAIANLEEKYGINDPLPQQYFHYLNNLLHGDLGESLKYTGTSVNELIGRGLPATSKLAAASFVTAIVIGTLLGIFASMKPRKAVDNICMSVSTIGICVPNYVLSILLMYVFGLKLKLVPIVGLSSFSSYILPTIALALNPIANIARLVRSGMIEALNQDYIITANSKGIRKRKVIGVHALKNALLPVVTYLGPLIAYLLTGSFVIENMFTISGVGKIFATSIINRDYTAVVGMTTFFGVIIVASGLIIDIVYILIDPRVKYE